MYRLATPRAHLPVLTVTQKWLSFSANKQLKGSTNDILLLTECTGCTSTPAGRFELGCHFFDCPARTRPTVQWQSAAAQRHHIHASRTKWWK